MRASARTPNVAPAASALLGRKSRQGEKFVGAGRLKVSGSVRRELHRSSEWFAYGGRWHPWIGESITAGGTTSQTRYVYDGNQVVMQFDGTGSGDLTAADLSHRYLWGPAVDQLLADDQLQVATPQVVWSLGDNENTVRDLALYDSGADTTMVVNHRVFSAYGELLSQTDPQTGAVAAVDCVFGYTGRPLSVLSVNATTGGADGLQFNGERWYDAITGRWLSNDPISYRAGDPDLYRYVGNGPTNATDPSGLARPKYGQPGWNDPLSNEELAAADAEWTRAAPGDGRNVGDYYDLRITQQEIDKVGCDAAKVRAIREITVRATGKELGEAGLGTAKEAAMGGLAYVTAAGIANGWNPVGWALAGIGAGGFLVWGIYDYVHVYQISKAAAEAEKLYADPCHLVP